MNFKENESAQKLRGGYYTPLDLAVFISKWIAGSSKNPRVLEPSCGDGVFFEALSKSTRKNVKLDAFELEPDEYKESVKRASSLKKIHANVLNEDFLEWFVREDFPREIFDGVLGNPPFIRYQYLPKSMQNNSQKIFENFGLNFTKHTNAWVPFVVSALSLLKPGGRLGMVLPSEILHVMHAQSLRTFFGTECSRLIIFDPEDLWFDNTLQGAIILLAEKKEHASDRTDGLAIVPVKGRSFADKSPTEYFRKASFINGKTVAGKWTRALLSNKEISLLESLSSNDFVHIFNDVASVDVGIVTGANKFFLVNDEVVKRFGLTKWAHPMFGRSEHCPGVLYDDVQHSKNREKGSPTNFLWFDVGDEQELSASARKYVSIGENEGLHKRYKCRIRTPWFKVPSVYPSEIGMLKRAHDVPRLIYNTVGAYTTDTSYRISSYGVSAKKLVSCFLTPLTALSAELEGRHYGGGVLELVPSEIEKLLIVLPNRCPPLRQLDRDFRKNAVSDILFKHGMKVMKSAGFSKDEHQVLLSAWNKLRMRRQRVSE